MKKLLATVALAIGLTTAATVPSHAGDDAAWLVGGIIGGMLLNEGLNHHHHGYNRPYRGPVYVYDEPGYRQVCRTVWVREYDPYYDEVMQVPKERCRWVRY